MSADDDGGVWVRRRIPRVLVVVATLLAVLSIFAVWADRQLLNTDNWTETSSELLEDAAIRAQVATYLTESLYDNVDVAGQVREALPSRVAPLAAPVASGLQDLVQRAALGLLGRPRVQILWEQANREAHELFLEVMEGGGEIVSTAEGTVTLNLRALLGEVHERVGLGGRIQQALPDDAAQITILRSDQLGTAQEVVQILQPLTILLVILTILLLALAVLLAQGRRRELVRAAGIGLVVAGVAVLLGRELAGDEVVDALATTEAVRPAAESAWSIGTSMLVDVAGATIAYGIAVVVGAWLVGPTRVARTVRRGLAPFLHAPHVAYGALVLALLLLVLWAPTPAFHMVLPTLLLIALLVAGFVMLRRLALREHPDASLEALGRSVHARLASRRPRRNAGARAGRPSDDEVRLTELERTARLRDEGLLTAEEFAQEKSRLLHAHARPSGE